MLAHPGKRYQPKAAHNVDFYQAIELKPGAASALSRSH
jgi:hypothetical protein